MAGKDEKKAAKAGRKPRKFRKIVVPRVDKDEVLRRCGGVFILPGGKSK